MNMQQMLQSVKKIQREYEKEHKARIEDVTFSHTQNGLVKVSLKGNFELEKIEILDEEALSKENKEMIEEMIVLAYQECKKQIDKVEEELMNKYQKQPGGMFF